MRLELHPEARAELRRAALWYDERRIGLGDEFIADVLLRSIELAKLPIYSQMAGFTRRNSADPARDSPPVPMRHRIRKARANGLVRPAPGRRRPLYWLSRAGG